jgi:hypothetical protein
VSTYGGAAVFGSAVSVEMTPAPSDAQEFSYFGVTGLSRLWGGGRGRRFTVRGVLTGATPADVAAARDLLLSYDDGIARTLYDSVEDVSWPAVVFTGGFRWSASYGANSGFGWARAYEAEFLGLL